MSKTKTSTKGAGLPPSTDMSDDLARAMVRAFDMSAEDAAQVAGIVVEQFEGKTEVNDDGLAADLRSLFYTLESRRIMSFRREEYENAEGQKRRAFHWRLRPEVVLELAAPPAQPTNEDIYHALPAECWTRAEKLKA